jgi:hypothetical protein
MTIIVIYNLARMGAVVRSKNNRILTARNVAYARLHWPAECSEKVLSKLRELTTRFCISAERGDVYIIDGGWYITSAGLLGIAHKRRCQGIRSQLLGSLSDPSCNRWIFKATVYKSRRSIGFVGFGDADPSNVSPLVRGAEMRVAETRAVNRALRKAYGIGLCSVEELGWEPNTRPDPQKFPSAVNNGHQSGEPRLRDRLCLLIRQHQLDANLVKAYAADSCGTPNLRDASREQIESFVTNLADWATKDRPALLCKLNSYAAPHEVSS